MSTGQSAFVGLLIGSLFLLALFVEPPAFMVRLFGRLVAATEAAAGWFYRGRHHVHAPLPARPFERERPTVWQIRARLVSEATFHLTIVPDVRGFDVEIPKWAQAVDLTMIGAGGGGRAANA